MNMQAIAQLIQEHFKFVREPSQDEIAKILNELSDSTTEKQFREIVYRNISDTTSFSFESIDMSATVSILKQIKDSLNK